MPGRPCLLRASARSEHSERARGIPLSCDFAVSGAFKSDYRLTPEAVALPASGRNVRTPGRGVHQRLGCHCDGVISQLFAAVQVHAGSPKWVSHLLRLLRVTCSEKFDLTL